MGIYDRGFIISFPDRSQMLVENFRMYRPIQFINHELKESETLLSISNEKFRTTSMWFVIAEMNPDIDIFNLEPGTLIKIPYD